MDLLLKGINESGSFRVDFDAPNAARELGEALFGRLALRPVGSTVVIVCIGTDRSTGDSLGPLVGSELLERCPTAHLYGTLEQPVHAVNLSDAILRVQKVTNPFVIAIDACLGQLSSVGQITLADGALRPGAGVHKKLPDIGNIHITGIVNVGGFMEYFVLQNTRLGIVFRMANVIADAVTAALRDMETSGATVEVSADRKEIGSRWGSLFRNRMMP